MNGSKHLQKKKIYQLRQTLNDINEKKSKKKRFKNDRDVPELWANKK